MNHPEQSLHDIRHALRLSDYLKKRRKSRRDFWQQHGGAKLACFVYTPPYPKELLEVFDWQPVKVADPALGEVDFSAERIVGVSAKETKERKSSRRKANGRS